MKRIAIAVLILGIIGGIFYFAPDNKVTIVKEEVTVTEKVDALEALVKDAIKASSTDTHNTAQESYNATVERIESEIRLQVLQEQSKLLDSEIEGLEKDLSVY